MSVEVDNKVSKKKRLSVLKFLSALIVAALLSALLVSPQTASAETAVATSYFVSGTAQEQFLVKNSSGALVSAYSFCVEPVNAGDTSGKYNYTRYDYSFDSKFTSNASGGSRKSNALNYTKKLMYIYALDASSGDYLNKLYKEKYGSDLTLTTAQRWITFKNLIDYWGAGITFNNTTVSGNFGAQSPKLAELLIGYTKSPNIPNYTVASTSLVATTTIPNDAKFVYLETPGGTYAQDTAYVELPKNPEITTSVTEKGNANDQSIPYNGGTVTDTVTYKRLKQNQAYTLVGTLMDKDTNKSIGVVRVGTFTPTTADGTTSLDITVPSGYAGKNLVVYESLYEGNLANPNDSSDTSKINNLTPVAKHEDIKATSQTFKVEVGPSIGTKAVNADTNAEDPKLLPAAGGQIKDTVSYQNLKPNTQYTLAGTLKVQDGTDTGADTNIFGIATFTTGSNTDANGLVSGSQDIVFTVPSTFTGKNLVAFEKLYEGNLTVNGSQSDISLTKDKTAIAAHENIKDADQSVTVDGPKIGTSAAKKDNPSIKELPVTGGTITDTVTYSNLQPGTQYTVTGQLMEKSATGTANPTGITGYATFTTPSGAAGTLVNGTVTVDFVVPADYAGKTLVAYEKLYQGNYANGAVPSDAKTVAVHENISDKAQTVTVQAPTMTTLAKDASDGDNTIDSNGGTVTDNVYYSGLKPNTTYTLDGKLVVKSDSSEVTGTRHLGTFTTGAADQGKETASGTAAMQFTVPASYAGQNLVAFEKLYTGDLTVSGNPTDFSKVEASSPAIKHENLDDASQTVSVTPPATPQLKTVATDATDGDKLLNVNGGNSTIKDTVYYSGLKPNTYYTLKGTPRYGKEYGSKGSQWGRNQGTTTFLTDATGNGIATVQISGIVKGGGDTGKTIVVYEELYEGKSVGNYNQAVAKHEDLNDLDQTVKFAQNPPAISLSTTATTDTQTTGHEWEVTGGQSIITDKVDYTGLSTSTDYTIKGEVMLYNKTTQQLTSSGITAESGSFRPTAANGSKSLSFDVSNIFEKYIGTDVQLVVFERLYDSSGFQVAAHTDPVDYKQTVFPTRPTVTTKASADSVTNNVLTMNDAFTFKGLVPNHQYHVTAQAVVTDANGAQQTVGQGTVDFTASAISGTQNVKISVPNYDTIKAPIQIIVRVSRAENVNGQAFYYGELASHNTDLKDLNEQVYRLTTKAEFTYANGANSGTPTGIKDTVTIYGLDANASADGATYYLQTTLISKKDQTQLLASPVKTNVDPAKPNNSPNQWVVTMDDKVTSGEAVVYQELHRVIGNEDTVVGIHKDINDAAQTLKKTDATTLKFRLEKVNKFDANQTLLKDAAFELHADENNSMKSEVLQNFVSDGQGHYDVSNLAPGTYWLLETKAPGSGAPDGQFMQLLPSPIQFQIKEENGKAVIVPLTNATGFLVAKGTNASDATQALGQVADVSVGDLPKAGDDKMIPLMLLSMSTILAGLAIAFRNTKKTKRR